MKTVFDLQGDLISRRALIEALKERLLGQPSQNVQAKRILHDQVAMAIETVEAAQVVDAEPVRNGRWVWFENRPVTDADDPECIGCTGYECSECGNNEGTCIRFYEELSPDMLARIKEGLMEYLTNYCHSCGAKMGGGDNP